MGPATVALAGCAVTWFQASDFDRMLATETSTRAAIELRVKSCTQADEVKVVASTREQPRQRQVWLGDVPAPLRMRTLALATAALIERPVPAPSPPAEPFGLWERAEAKLTVGPKMPVPPPTGFLNGDVAFRSRLLPRHGAFLLGPQLGLSVRPWPAWPIEIDAGGLLELGRQRDRRGSVGLMLLGGGAGVAGLFAVGPHTIAVGPRVEVAWARVTGRADLEGVSASNGSTWVSLASLAVTFRSQSIAGLRLMAQLHADATMRGVEARADDTVLLSLSGITAGLRVGLSFPITPI